MPKTQKDLPQDAALQAGLTTRNQVMGAEYVDRALAGASDYTLPMQEFITRNAWGNVWQRPGLDLRTRSLITVAMLTRRANSTSSRPMCAARSTMA
jgi:4-carboxymuconolactone decarboxylase